MKAAVGSLVLFFLLLSAGCAPRGVASSAPAPVSEIVHAGAEGRDLFVSLRLPKSRFVPGEEVPLTIVARNRGRKGLRFTSRTSAPYRLRLEKMTPLGWETIQTYPESAARVLSEWSLRPGETRTIETKLLVERNWPTYENLRLRVNLPGRPDVAPFVHLEVAPAEPRE